MAQQGDPAVTIWRDDALTPAEWMRGSFTDFCYDPHAHDTACFALITRGAICIRTGGRDVVARRGDLFAVDTGSVHAGWPVDHEGWSQRSLYLEVPRLAELLRDRDTGRTRFDLGGPVIRDTELAGRMLAAHQASERRDPRLQREEALFAFVQRLFDRHVRPFELDAIAGREPAAVHRAKEFLDSHLDTRVSLHQIAAAVGLPPFRLLRAFKRAEGISPHTYQRQARLRAATALLREGCPLGEIAATAGFADQPHFTRLFRRIMGVSPAAYRRACANVR